MLKFYKYCYRLSILKIVIFGILLSITLNLLLSIVVNCFFPEEVEITNKRFENDSILFLIFAAVLIGPLIETYLMQYLPLKIGHRFFKKWKYHYGTIILLSSFVFAISHPSQVSYFIAMFFFGLILSFICFLLMRRKKYPVEYTALIHAGYNGWIVLAVYLEY